MKLKTIIFILVSVFFISSVSAQKNNKKITITGTVQDAAGFPIVNAIVMIDGNNTSSVTDSKGGIYDKGQTKYPKNRNLHIWQWYKRRGNRRKD